jgi:hypothetical protein
MGAVFIVPLQLLPLPFSVRAEDLGELSTNQDGLSGLSGLAGSFGLSGSFGLAGLSGFFG